MAAGSLVAGYRLEEQVGAGGMAVVFRARDERLGRLVALKILAPALAADEAFRQRFVRESRAAAAVDDPHIIPVFEAGEARGVLFLAMRYVPGGDMRTILYRDGPLPPARLVAIVSPVASALDAAHGAGLVHRDVKPANMLVDIQAGRPDHVYLSDFGLSKGVMSASVGLTGTGSSWARWTTSPREQIEGKPVDGRVDQYAPACAAFELLTGAPPFRRDEARMTLPLGSRTVRPRAWSETSPVSMNSWSSSPARPMRSTRAGSRMTALGMRSPGTGGRAGAGDSATTVAGRPAGTAAIEQETTGPLSGSPSRT